MERGKALGVTVVLSESDGGNGGDGEWHQQGRWNGAWLAEQFVLDTRLLR